MFNRLYDPRLVLSLETFDVASSRIELDVHVDEICAATRGRRANVINNSLLRDSALSTGLQRL